MDNCREKEGGIRMIKTKRMAKETKAKTRRAPAAKSGDKAEFKGSAKKGVQEMVTEPDGQRRLPGQAVKVVKELVQFANRHEESKETHRLATARLVEEGYEGLTLFAKHKEHFEEDGEGGFIYQASGVQIIIPKAAVKVKTKRIAPE